MTAAIRGGVSNSGILHQGVEVVTFGSTGITSGAGRRLAQSQYVESGALTTGPNSVPIPSDNTIPQSNEGDQFLPTLNITPTKVGSLIKVMVDITFSSPLSGTNGSTVALFQDAGVNAVVSRYCNQPNTVVANVVFTYRFTTVSLAALAFKLRIGAGAVAVTTLNGQSGVGLHGGVLISSLTAEEYWP